jgi:hypothetical protein
MCAGARRRGWLQFGVRPFTSGGLRAGPVSGQDIRRATPTSRRRAIEPVGSLGPDLSDLDLGGHHGVAACVPYHGAHVALPARPRTCFSSWLSIRILTPTAGHDMLACGAHPHEPPQELDEMRAIARLIHVAVTVMPSLRGAHARSPAPPLRCLLRARTVISIV